LTRLYFEPALQSGFDLRMHAYTNVLKTEGTIFDEILSSPSEHYLLYDGVKYILVIDVAVRFSRGVQAPIFSPSFELT